MSQMKPEFAPPPEGAPILALDTCGPMGSVALGRVVNGAVQTVDQIELDGHNCSATLLAAIRQLLQSAQVELRELSALIVVNGPGSFTGVRVGLSAAKGLAEATGLGLATVSRLEVLAAKAGTPAAALDAHRHEVFLLVTEDRACRELLAGRQELGGIAQPSAAAVCDEPAAALLESAWPGVKLARTAAPTAADALPLGLERMRAGLWADVALADGHYLRRSDAEIFGEKPPKP